MSHVYQPVMLMKLHRCGGRASEEQIAKDLVVHDRSQIEYYVNVTNNMVGKVLRKHGIVERDRASQSYRLLGYESLSTVEVDSLMELCERRLEEYIAKRGDQIYQHRRQSAGHISGTLKYEVLKRARFRCELCGISAEEKALEVDHIVPRNLGGDRRYFKPPGPLLQR